MAMASVATDSSLQGKVVLITGGRRVGSELAPMLADRGANIAMTYRFSRAVIEHTLTDVQSRGVEGMAVAPTSPIQTRPLMQCPRSSRGSAAWTHLSTWPAFTGELRWPLWTHTTLMR